MTGILIGGLGAGAGENATGFQLGLIGVGAGETMTGVNVGGIGVGAGEALSGLTIGAIGAGSQKIRGVTIAGIAAGGVDITGITAAIGMVKIENDGIHTGFNLSAFNFIKGTQVGFSIGIVNYAYTLKGIQIGLVNYVRDNPKYLKVLPIINANF